MINDKKYFEEIEKYTLDELVDSANHIDEEQYPERHKKLISIIKERKKQGTTAKESNFPTGIKIISYLLILDGIGIFVAILLSLFLPAKFAFKMIEAGHFNQYEVIVAMGTIALGYNMLKLKPWTRQILMGFLFIGVLLSPIGIILKKIQPIWGIILAIIYLLLIFYLKSPKIKEVFKYE